MMLTRTRLFIFAGVVVAVLVTILVLGCRSVVVVKDTPTENKLMAINCSKSGEVASTNFICPEKGIGFTLMFEDDRGDERDYGSPPDWSLRILLAVYESEDKQAVYKSEYDKSRMTFTNWHGESTSVLLGDKSIFEQLSPNKSYKISLRIIKPDPALGVGTLYINWFEAR